MSKLYTDLSSTTTNEVDNLDSILVMNVSGAPLAATHDGAVQFDGDSRFGKIELCD